MSRISREEVERVVALARLALDEELLDAMQRDLDAVLGYAEALAGVDTEGVEPTAHVIPLATPLRDDLPEPPLDAELAVAGAPDASGTAFRVPVVVAGEEEG